MPVLRFRANEGVDAGDLSARVASGTINSVSEPSPGDYIDIDVDAGGVGDVVEYMATRGFALFATDPASTIEEDAAADIPPVTAIREGGGADLDIGAIDDGEVLIRSGTTVVSRIARDQIAGRLVVGMSGDVDYTSIKDAIDAALLAGANANNWYFIEIYPGTYFEDPMSVPTGIYVVGQTHGISVDGVFVRPNNPALTLFNLTGGICTGLNVRGVTGSGEACFKSTTAGVVNAVYACSTEDCSNGVFASGAGVSITVVDFTAIVNALAIPITEAWIRAANGATVLGNGVLAVAPAALIPFYSVNPIEKLVWAESGSLISIVTGLFNCSPKNNAQVGAIADGGGRIVFTGMTVENCYTAVKVGSGAGASKFILQGSSLRTNTVDFSIQSATGLISVSCSVDHIPITDIVAGGILTGTIFNTTDAITETRGTYEHRFNSDRTLDVPRFYHQQSSTGLSSGGAVTDAGGLTVDVDAGVGWVIRDSPEFDSINVTWTTESGLSLTASATNYVYYDGATLSGIVASTSAPGPSAILLAIVVTNGSGIRFIHAAPGPVGHIESLFHAYLLATRKFAVNFGLITDVGSTATKLDVGSGAYYRALYLIAYAGSGGDATWSYFYGTNGATEVASVTDVNTSQYDNAGTLTAMTTGWFRADTLILTSDGRLSLIYGTAEYATQAEAENAGTATIPTFMEESGIYLALVVVEEAVGIASILDARPKPGESGGVGGGGAGVTDHGDLTGLGDDDHTQYVLVSGARAMGGNLSLGGNNIVSVNLVDGVDVSTHAGRHNPGGSDANATAAAVAASIGQANAEGTAASFARSDHTHAHASAAPVNVTKAANAEGAAATFSRTDHKHDVSTAAPSATGVDTASGEGAATTLARSDHTHQANTAPVNVTKAVAAIGTSGEPARADHKHDVSTAAPAQGIGGSNAEGAATSLARSDHDHTLRETNGPTNLTIGSILDGQVVQRAGSVLVGVGFQTINGFRLTGVTGTPVMTADNTALSTIYLTPFISNQIALYDGSAWKLYASAEVSLAVTGRTTDLPFDIFAYDSGGIITLEFTDWSTATARATALALQDGVWVRSGAVTRRYLGTCRPRSTTTYSWVAAGVDAPARFDLWNAYNRVPVGFSVIATTNSWTYTTATIRQAQGSANYQVDVVAGLQLEAMTVGVIATSSNGAGANNNNMREVGVGVDSTTAFSGLTGSLGLSNNVFIHSTGRYDGIVPIGRHFYAWLEISTANNTTTWYGDNGAARIQSGMSGRWTC